MAPAAAKRAATARATSRCSRRLSAIRSASSGGSLKAKAAACWIGAAGADQISLPMPIRPDRSRRPRCSPASASAPPGSRAAPIRQPPRARLLLSAVVTIVRPGA